ncbi:hypothetical protein ACJMK2_034370, partial [Sinanodonta woodiana]
MVSKSGYNDGLSSSLDFEWDKMMYDANKGFPSLLELVKTSTTRKQRKITSLVPVIDSLLFIISFMRIGHSTILQQLVSIIMWLGSTISQPMYVRLEWCQSIDATRRRIHGLSQDFDSKVKLRRDKLSGRK